MPFKVAIASNNNQTINEHFGRARHFLIFDLVEQQFKLTEVREFAAPHTYGQSHNMGEIMNMVNSLADCQLVLASQIGPGAAKILEIKGIKSYAVSDLIDSTLEQLAASAEVKNYLRNQE